MPGSASVTISRTRLQRFLTAVGGPGERLLRRKADRVAQLARQYAAPHGSIAAGIEVGPYRDGSVTVKSTHPATLFVHNGTRPHLIRPRRARYLRFTVGGRVVYTKLVRHPGNRSWPFLTDALRDAR